MTRARLKSFSRQRSRLAGPRRLVLRSPLPVSIISFSMNLISWRQFILCQCCRLADERLQSFKIQPSMLRACKPLASYGAAVILGFWLCEIGRPVMATALCEAAAPGGLPGRRVPPIRASPLQAAFATSFEGGRAAPGSRMRSWCALSPRSERHGCLSLRAAGSGGQQPDFRKAFAQAALSVLLVMSPAVNSDGMQSEQSTSNAETVRKSVAWRFDLTRVSLAGSRSISACCMPLTLQACNRCRSSCTS